MATEEQRERQLKKDIAKSAATVKGVLKKSQRSINGAIKEFTALQNYLTNNATRNALYTELAKEYKVLNSNVNDWVESEVNVTSKNWWNYAKEDLPKGAVKGTFGAFSDKYVEDIIGFINPATVDTQVAMNAQIGGMMTNDIRALRAAVSTTLAEGAVEGLTNPQMAERMLSKVSQGTGKFAFIDKAGRNWTADSYFGMLNRTLHAQAARQTYINTATTELGYDLYQIEGGVTGSSLDNANDPCDAWAGKIISMTGKTKGYPTYADAVAAGVFHVQCQHFVRALLPSDIPDAKAEEKELREKEEALEDE